MPHLKSLDLSENPIRTITKSFDNLPSLQSLHLARTNPGEDLSSSFNHLPALTSVDLSENLTGLRKLRLDHNRLSAAECSGSFSSMPRLQLLNLSNNALEAIPECFCELTPLLRLDLSSNLIGAIPARLLRLSSLKHLDLSLNKIVDDDLPVSLGNISGLEVLNLGGNEIRQLPGLVGDLLSLRSLSLSHNMIQSVFVHPGEAPPNLECLDLSWNLLRTIPDGLIFLQRLESLQLSNNRIREFSHVLDSISTLVSVDLSFNDLSVRLPEGVTWLSRVTSLNVAHNQLTEQASHWSREFPAVARTRGAPGLMPITATFAWSLLGGGRHCSVWLRVLGVYGVENWTLHQPSSTSTEISSVRLLVQ